VVQKPIKTSFGWHIILVKDQSNSKYVVEKIVNAVKISAATSDDKYNAANDFAYLAGKNGFEKEAELTNYLIQESPPFNEKAPSIPGIGVNLQLVKFAFDNGLNDVSEVFRVSNKYVVAKVSEIISEGFRSFEEVQTQVKQAVLTEKKFEKSRALAEELIKKSSADLNKIPQIDGRFQLKLTNRFNSQSSIPQLGREYLLINKCLEMKPGETTTEPVKGLRGYFLIKLLEKTNFDSTAYKTQSTTIRNSILQEKKTAYVNTWLAQLKENADIIDNRHQFYGY